MEHHENKSIIKIYISFRCVYFSLFLEKKIFMKRILPFFLLAFVTLSVIAQPSINWQKSYGGSDHEYAWKTISTSDGGYAFVGNSDSNDGDVLGQNNGGSDLWVAKTNSTGAIQWSYLFGGTDDEEGFDIYQTADGGYMVVGLANSADGDVTGHHGSSGNSDAWVLKLTSSGTLDWNKCFGGTSDDEAVAIGKTLNGDFFLAGTTYSYDGDVSGNHGTYETDCWVFRISATGTLLDQRCVGGTAYEELMDMIITADDGCILAGRSYSTDGDVSGYHAGSDMLIAKLNSSLDVDWAKCYGGSQTEEGNGIVQLADGSYVALGYCSTHNNGDVTGHHGSQGSDDFWLLKLTATGGITWAKCYGGDGDDQANGLCKTMDGGFVMSGLTNSTNGDVTGFHTGAFDPDIWVAMVDASGTLSWQRCCGGSGQDESFNVMEASSNHYIVTGFTYSADYDVTVNLGSADGWIFDLSVLWGVEENDGKTISVYPNPFSNQISFTLPALAATPERIAITDLTGKEVMLIDPLALLNKNNITATELKPGMYFVEISGPGYKAVKKLVKE
jgi:hypothetical protein